MKISQFILLIKKKYCRREWENKNNLLHSLRNNNLFHKHETLSKLEITHYNILIASHIDLIKETQRDIVIKSLKFILTALVCHFEDKINANISTVYISKNNKNIQIEYTAKLEITEIQNPRKRFKIVK